MGCITSKHKCNSSDENERTDFSMSGDVSHDAQNRIEVIDKAVNAKLGCMNVRYGFLSQRGFYPDEPNKLNQDSYSITTNISDEESDTLFAVYDGHGRHGDLCAQFARDNLPQLISKFSEKIKKETRQIDGDSINVKNSCTLPTLTKRQVESACSSAHRHCNTAMRKEQTINDSLSGTTAISCLVHGKESRITVCNLGDSRAVLGQRIPRNSSCSTNGDGGDESKRNDGMAQHLFRALPLSSDQTPYRQDERKRIKATGARILSLDQIEGLEPIRDDDEDDKNSINEVRLGEQIDEGGDPPRVWSPLGDYPGTAFTRSFGDSIAEQLGVNAEPEIVVRDLLPEDRIIVLATDGVFEFLTNQSVIDICAKYDDPLEACRAVVAESYELWLQFELRTDDITMVCIFVDSIENIDSSKNILLQAENNDEVDYSAKTPISSERPTRKWFSRSASKNLAQMRKRLIDETDEVPDDFHLTKLFTEKTIDEKSRINEAINSIAMLKSLKMDQKNMVIAVMEPIDVKKGDWIIRQGTVGDRLFIVDNGTFEVRKVEHGTHDDDESGGNIVHTYIGSRESNRFPAFGELALINSEPRAASIIAQTDGQLWALHRYSFREVLALNDDDHGRQDLIATLRKIPSLNEHLNDDEIKKLSKEMEEVTFSAGDIIIEKDVPGDSLYVIREGTCEVNSGLKLDRKSLDYFGEEVMNRGGNSNYLETIVAKTATTCWKIDHSNF